MENIKNWKSPFVKSEEEKEEGLRRKLVKADKIAQLNREHEAELRSRDRELSDHKRIISIRNSEIAQAERRFIQAQEKHDRELQRCNDKAQGEKREMTGNFNRIIEDMKNKHALGVADLERNAQIREERLMIKHQQQLLRLQKEVEEINDALLTRDDDIYQSMVFTASGLPKMTDNQIRDSFLEIQHMVEELGSRPWKYDQRLWPEELIQKLNGRHPETLVRQVIIQDMIWSLLFQHIFGSPFRVFGDAGKKLEAEWNESCAQDESPAGDKYTWPIAGIKTERWRIMTLKACHEALREPLSQVDPRAGVKDGYLSNLNDLIESLQRSLEAICEISNADVELPKRLCKKAVRQWLDFGLHRCRIRIYMASEQLMTVADKVALAQTTGLMLTAAPLVGRYGNDKGIRLESFTTIDGCRGDSIAIP